MRGLLLKKMSIYLMLVTLLLFSSSCSMVDRISVNEVEIDSHEKDKDETVRKSREAKTTEARKTTEALSENQTTDDILLVDAPIKVNDEMGNTIIFEDLIASSALKKVYSDGLEAYVIEVVLTEEGSQIFAEFTEANIGKHVTMLYDNMIYAQPVIQIAVTGGRFQFGNMSFEEAQELLNRSVPQQQNHSIIDKSIFMPSSPGNWNSIQSGSSKIKVYDARDGEWVRKENHEKFKVNGVYVTSAYIKEDDFTYYWINSSGNKGLGGPMELTSDFCLVNFYPGTTDVRSLEFSEVSRSELYPAIVNSIFSDCFSSDYSLEPKGKWDDGLFYQYRFVSNSKGYIQMDIDNYDNKSDFKFDIYMSRESDQYEERLICVLELLEPLADLNDIESAINMFDFNASNNQTYIVDGYYFEIKLTYMPYPHGNKLFICNY